MRSASSMVATAADGIAGLPLLERPREKLLVFGRQRLSDVELIALVLGGGRSLQRGLVLLQRFGGMAGLDRALPQELCGTPGVGEAGAAALSAAFELSRRAQQQALPHTTPIQTPDDVAGFLRASFGHEDQEMFVVLGLDTRQRVRLIRTVAIGTVSQVDVHPREVYRPLVRAGMFAAIAVHNHPSGDPGPSDADIELTHRLAEAGRVLGIPLLDHLVVTVREITSLAALGLVPRG